MQNPPEGLIYLLVLAVAYLANYLFKRFGPKMEPVPPQAEVDEGPTAQEPVPVGLAAASIASFTPLPGPQVALAKAMLSTQPRGRLPRLALLGGVAPVVLGHSVDGIGITLLGAWAQAAQHHGVDHALT